jgi:hypothetical protein
MQVEIQHVTSCNRVAHQCQMCVHLEHRKACVHLALVCDPVMTGHMLNLNSHPKQYSGFMYVSQHKQSVFVQLLYALYEGLHTKIKMFFHVIEIKCF